MAVNNVNIEDYLKTRDNYFLVDVRSEGEFEQGHIPGAVNIPVLNNEERKIVGTLYKQQGNQKAVLKGFELAGPRFYEMMKETIKLSKGKPLMIYCWRGGMRSDIFSWLMSYTGIPVCRIKGGYKKYRNLTYYSVRKDYDLIVMGGRTGCGKTELLAEMRKRNFQVIDLEGLANHKGSVYGGINMPPQPSSEQFENMLAEEFWKLDVQKPIWVENENQLIGKVIMPLEIKEKMNNSPLVHIELSPEERYLRIEKEYGVLPKEELMEATKKLEKRLGNKRMNEAIKAIDAGNNKEWIPILMDYYDKGYLHAVAQTEKSRIVQLDISGLDMEKILLLIKGIELKIIGKWKNRG